MKKSTMLLGFAALLSLSAQAQVNIVSKDNYGMVHDVNFYPSIPDKLIARTAINHLVASTDKGQTWQIIFDDPNGAYLSDLEVNHQLNICSFHALSSGMNTIKIYDLNQNTIVKEYILPQPAGVQIRGVKKYKLYNSNYDIMMVEFDAYVNGEYTTLYKITKDGGETWNDFYQLQDGADLGPSDFEFDGYNPDKIYLAFSTLVENHEKGGIHISTDGGQTYTATNEDKYFYSLYTYAERPNEVWGIYYAPGSSYSRLMKTPNGGTNWEEINLNWEGGAPENISWISVNPHDPQHIVILETNEIATSFDGGETFTITSHTYETAADYNYGTKISFNSANSNEYVLRSLDMPIMTLDNGNSFSVIMNPYENTLNNVIFQSNESGDHLVYGVMDGFVYVNDQNDIYHPVNLLDHGMISFGSTSFYKDRHQEGKMFIQAPSMMGHSFGVSFDYGQNIHHLDTNFLKIILFTYTHPKYPNIVWAHHIHDEGNYGEFKKIDFSGYEEGIVFTEELDTPFNHGFMWGFAIHNTDPNIQMIAARNEIYKSTDNGATWNLAMNGIPSTSYNEKMGEFITNPFNENEIFMATSLGTFKTQNFGDNWEQLNSIPAHNIYPSDKTEGHLVSITNNSGATYLKISLSHNGGETWKEFNHNELGHVITTSWSYSNDVYFTENQAHVYIASADVGVVKYVFDFDDLSVSEPEFVTQNNISVYPNPTSDVINVVSQEAIEDINIYDFTGKKLFTTKNSNINVNHLPKGNYILTVKHKNGKVSSQKFIKK